MTTRLFRVSSNQIQSQEVGVSAHLIQLRNVDKAYRSVAGDFYALKDINLTVDRGEFVTVIGKSGAGKSTLVNMITGIDQPNRGEIFVGGVGLHNLKEEKIAVWRGKNVGVIFQFFQLLPRLTCIQNVMLPMDFADLYEKPAVRRERAMYLLGQVGIADQADKLPSAVSGGQRQRVAIARALANDPNLVVADEPTGNLDSATADDVFNVFEELVRQGRTVVMVTHDRDLAARSDRIVPINDGRLTEISEKQENYGNEQNLFIN